MYDSPQAIANELVAQIAIVQESRGGHASEKDLIMETIHEVCLALADAFTPEDPRLKEYAGFASGFGHWLVPSGYRGEGFVVTVQDEEDVNADCKVIK